MALLWVDGFDSYGTTPGNAVTGLANKYSSASADSNFTLKAGRLSGNSIQALGGTFFESAFTAAATVIIGFAYKQDRLTNNQEIIEFKDSTSVQCSLQIQSDGEVALWRGASFALLGATNGAKIQAGTWNYIEIKVTIHNTAGAVTISVNGSTVLTLTSVNTRQGTSNNQATSVRFTGNLNGTDKSYWDDIYICDTSGSNNNAILGPQKVQMILPSADNGSQQWTTSSGTVHFSLVNENPHDSSTTYVTDTVSGHVDLWDYADTSGLANVKGIQQNTVFETDSASAFSINQRCKSSSTTSDATGVAGTNGTFKTTSRVLETDPNTSALWTTTNLNAAQFGVKVV